jgi:peptidoglycan/xylan/chitin deacetylase (PgdA/CDA1 family)
MAYRSAAPDSRASIENAGKFYLGLPMLQNIMAHASRQMARQYRSKPFQMKNCAPLVSFTFDECPDSAFKNGASILEDHGLRGTYYVAAGKSDADDTYWHVINPQQIRALYERGHEIGCHTYSLVNIETVNTKFLDEECRKNHNLLRRLCGDIRLTNFCYPFGRVSFSNKLQLQKRFDSCRGNYEGVNVGTIDLGLLKVVELYNRTLTTEKLQHVLRETREHNGWVIFCMHDVDDPPTFMGCSPALLRSTIEMVQKMGISCVTVREGLRQIGYRAS